MFDLTAVGGGYYYVKVDGEKTSKHTQEREVIQHAQKAKLANPDARVTYTHEYEVLVELAAAAPEKPAPEPEEPEPEPEEPAPAPDPGTREPDIEEAFAYSATAQLLASPLYARSEDIN